MSTRADRHLNPTCFTTALAFDAGLKLGIEYEQGDPFEADGRVYYTARLLPNAIENPVDMTIRLIDAVGFRTHANAQRWSYISLPDWLWHALDKLTRVKVIQFMYENEGGTELNHLFT